MKLKVGIFFGGPSREREQSYLSGRTVFEYLDRALFDPVPVFVDHDRRFVRLEWPLLQREGIRDFYPAMELLPPSPHGFRIYADSLGELPEEDRERLFERIGRPLTADELPQLIDLAFLALPGPFGSDGELQALLSARGIPCTGSGADTCRTLADHARRQQRLVDAGLNTPAYQLLEREQWVKSEASVAVSLRFPIRVLPARHPMMQDGTLIETPADTEAFADAVNKAFFREVIPVEDWRRRSLFDRVDHLQLLTDLEDSLGFPLDVRTSDAIVTVYHPEQLLQYLDEQAARREPAEAFILERREPARQVLLEEVPAGQVFSCLVVETDSGQALALLPAGSGRGAGTGEVFHPLDLPAELLGAARQACEQAFSALRCRGLARIDGLIAADGKVWIRQVQPTPAYTPLSFVFQQLALLGLSPSRSLTFLLHQSLRGQAPEPSEHRLATAPPNRAAARIPRCRSVRSNTAPPGCTGSHRSVGN